MKKKYKLKKEVIPIFSILVVVLVIITTIFYNNQMVPEELSLVSTEILNNDIPVVSNIKVLIKPYTANDVAIANYFYDSSDKEEGQINSIIYYEGSYMQNSGINYISDNIFDVISIYDGTVISVENNDISGNIVKIKHDNNIISVYQGLSDVQVKENDVIKQNMVIGKSGKSKLLSNLGNHLHFELCINGINVDPEEYYGKTISSFNGD